MDISLVHIVSPSDVHFSVWKVVDAVHNAPCFSIKVHECYDKKREIARKVQAIISADFDNFFGAIDGLLTWKPKPNDNDVSVSAVGVKIFFVNARINFD